VRRNINLKAVQPFLWSMLHNAATLGLLRRIFLGLHFNILALLPFSVLGPGHMLFSVDVGTKPPRQRRYPVVPALCYSSGYMLDLPHARPTDSFLDAQIHASPSESKPIYPRKCENFREAERGLRSCLSLTGTRPSDYGGPGQERPPPCSPDCPRTGELFPGSRPD